MSGIITGIRGFAVLALLGLAACSGGGTGRIVAEGTSAAQILALADAAAERGRYKKAAEYYNEVERLYPYSAETQLALIGSAKAYREKRMYAESRASAMRFLDFYPTTADAPFAMYLVALSYYDQIIDVERDQSNTLKALRVFQTIIETYPGSQYAALSEEKFGIAMNQLAGKEMDIGRYYLKRGHYVAAIERFRVVVDEYGDNAQTPEATYRLIEGYLSLGLVGEAQVAYNLLGSKYPDSVWFSDAAKLMSGR